MQWPDHMSWWRAGEMVFIAVPAAQAALMGLLKTLPVKGGAPPPAEQHDEADPQTAHD